MKLLRDKRGFTLVEMIVAMAIFLTIMMVTANSFKTVLNQVSQQSKSAETFVEAIVGLEVLRSDVKHAGFGLPWSFQATPVSTAYTEAQVASNNLTAAGFSPSVSLAGYFNDAPGNPPRAIQSSGTSFNVDSAGVGSQYLVIKSMLVGASPAAKKWTNVAFAGGAHTYKKWGDSTLDLAAGDRVIVVKNSLNAIPPTAQLMVNGAGTYSTTFNNYSTLIRSHQDGDTFEVYGVDTSNLIMPFNRADYYVMTPAYSAGSTGMPAYCAPHTGVLYKSVLNHADGGFTQIPLLDCVADMQVVYGLDTSGAGFINLHTTAPLTTAQDIRNQLREIRIYILAHEGQKDSGFTYPSGSVVVGESFGGAVQGRTFNLQALIGSGWQNYRWKVYTMVVRPRNLSQ